MRDLEEEEERNTLSNLKIAHSETLCVYAHLPVSESGNAGWPAGCLAAWLTNFFPLPFCFLPPAYMQRSARLNTLTQPRA